MEIKKKENIEINGVIYTPVHQEYDYEEWCQECELLDNHNKGECSLFDNCPVCWVEKHHYP